MEVVKDNYNTFPVATACTNCYSDILLTDESDCGLNSFERIAWKCPCCGRTNELPIDMVPLCLQDKFGLRQA